MVLGASGRGLMPAFCGLVSHRVSIASSAVSFLSPSFAFGFGRLAAAAVSRLHFFSFAFGVGYSRGCGGFVSSLFSFRIWRRAFSCVRWFRVCV